MKNEGAAGPQGGGTMRLSEAIRLGAMLRPQGFDGYFPDEKACAMGAALLSVHGVCATKEAGAIVMAHWPWSRDPLRMFSCPARCTNMFDLGSKSTEEAAAYVVAHLNDHHRWTRERIADWVATIEPDAGEPSQARERVTESDSVPPEVRHG